MSRHTRRLAPHVTLSLFAFAALLVPSTTHAETIVCRSLAPTVKAVTIAEDYFSVTRLFQTEDPNEAPLEPLLETTISVAGTGPSCVVASFSAVVKPSDNYLVFQVTVDGVPMHGHGRFYTSPDIPVVVEMEETDLNQARMIAHQFFLRVNPGVHTVRVNVARGSGPGPFDPSVEGPVLTIQYD
jgi:hypothetical protein